MIDAFIDALDLLGLGLDGAQPAATGRPSYHPSVLLKLYIYGYLNPVQSSRRLEREADRNVELMWLVGRLVPDHKTIADFRRDNGAAIQQVCGRFVLLCEVVRAGLRALRERDEAVERWLRGEVAASYDAMKADPDRGISLDTAFGAIRDRHASRWKDRG